MRGDGEVMFWDIAGEATGTPQGGGDVTVGSFPQQEVGRARGRLWI